MNVVKDWHVDLFLAAMLGVELGWIDLLFRLWRHFIG